MASELRINKVSSDAKKVTIATSAAFHATDLPSWKSTCELTVVGRRLFVRNATTLAQKLAPLKSTCESIQEKIPIVECSATIYATMLEVSRDISSSILVKNPMHAISAVSLAAI